jgi:hypothetical protein
MTASDKPALYITDDGLTQPLVQSQVLAYLEELYHLLSFLSKSRS